MSFNKVFLMGNLTRDVEVKALPGGTSVAKIGLAVNRKWKDKSGESKEEVLFVDCDAFGKTGEVMAQYLSKGKPVFIEGRLKLDQWEDQQGQKRSALRVVVESFQFIGGREGGEGGGRGDDKPIFANRASNAGAVRRASRTQAEAPEGDDIPF